MKVAQKNQTHKHTHTHTHTQAHTNTHKRTQTQRLLIKQKQRPKKINKTLTEFHGIFISLRLSCNDYINHQ